MLSILVLLGAAGAWPGMLTASSTGISGVHGNPTNTDANTCRQSGCHDAAALSATISLGGPTSVLHGTTSTSNFTINGSGGTRRGFNLAIYRVSGNVKQTTAFSSLSGGMQVMDNELTHTAPQTATSWSYRWTAPSTLGTYRIYACVNPVNNDTFSTGDGPANCTTRNVSVTNNNPNAVNDTNIITVSEDATTWSGTFNVLLNDLQTEGDAFVWNSTSTAGLVGLLDDNNDGTYRYDPNGQFESLDTGEFGTATFSYTIRESAYPTFTDSATVTIRISGVNDAPVANDDGSVGLGNGHVTINEGDTANGVGNILGNDSDVDDAITASRAGPGCNAVSPSEATSFTLNANGSFDYAHDGSEPVQDSFSYCAFDGTVYSAVRTVYIDIAAVNDPPVISGFDGSVGYTEQTPVVVDNSISISDIDSSEINQANLTISANFAAGDSLACGALPPAISCGSFNVGTRTLTLSGQAPYTDYYTAIGNVTFDSSSDNPSLAPRTIDLDVRDEDLGTSLDAQKIITVTRLNDPPTLAAIADQVALEDTAADPFTFSLTAVASDVDVDDDVNDGLGSLTYSLSGEPAGMAISSASPTHGQISWNPPQTGIFGQVYGPITVLIEDGDEDVSPPNSVSFNITVSPPDADGDLVANYDDVCLTVADGSNADNDGDGTPGSDGGINDGGDVCDADDDNDGMPDTYENSNSLDPFDAADAIADNDGDGISNLDEFLAGSNPNLVNLVIDATGYLTPFDLPAPAPTSIHTAATGLVPSISGPYRPGNNDITWTAINAGSVDLAIDDPANLVSVPPVQQFRIRPLASISADQQVEEGAAASVVVSLNGDAPSWPATAATVAYSVAGTANNPADHDAVGGVLTFADGVYSQAINFNVAADALIDPGETVVITLTSASNAAVGARASHRSTIIEGNAAPRARLRFRQGGDVLGSVYAGSVDIDVVVNDANAGQSFSYDWSGTDNALLPPMAGSSWTSPALAAGNYLVDVIVTDDGLPAASTRVRRVMNVIAAPPMLMGGDDTDGDGTDDTVEGFDDSDGDGIPDYLDALDGGGQAHLLADQTSNFGRSFQLQTEPGLRLALGNTAQASSAFGAMLTDGEIAAFGGPAGGATVFPDDGFDHFGGIYDFEVSGLLPGATVRVVIPLSSSIPRNAQYRKFNPATGWGRFVEDANNRVFSARGAPGACPEPGSSAYRGGLNYLDHCVQLLLQDGGPNDTDNEVNAAVSDPGSIGVRLTQPRVEEVEDGGGQMPWSLLALLAALAVFARRRQCRSAQR